MSMHLHEDDSNLMVYLPRKKVPQQHAFNKHLPERLLQWLMTEEDSQIRNETSDRAVIAMKDIWNSPLATLSTTLDECGIITISIPNVDPEIDESLSDSESEIVSERATGHRNGSRTTPHGDDSELDTNSEAVYTPPSATGTSHNGIAATRPRDSLRISSSTSVIPVEPISLPVRSTGPDRGATPLVAVLDRGDDYQGVLECVIASAATSIIPHRSEGSIGGLQGNFSSTAWRGTSRIRGATQFEENCKIGAAGELFVSPWHCIFPDHPTLTKFGKVFELLSRLDPALPNFSRANWQSTMRRYVKVHPAYASMSPWTGIETSDITYADAQGVLTDLLIRNHYLDRERWAGKCPHYFIEVKTTTLACDAPFYMSNAQYERVSAQNPR